MQYSYKLNWKTFGWIACLVTLSTCAQAQNNLPTVRILATDPTALEGTSSATFTLIRKGDTNSDLQVNVDISGTAANGVDYTTIATPLTIPAGYLAIDVPVQPILNTVTRGNKTVLLTLQPGSAYSISGRGNAQVKIVDDIFDVPPPTVDLTSPADGSTFTAPAVVTLSANVESQVDIQNVAFYVNDKLIARLTNSPYTITWTNSTKGKFTVFARAEDEFNKSGSSVTAHVTVSDTPVVTVVSPIGNTVSSEQFIPLVAQFADPNEQISSVSFYINKKLVGTVTAAPFVYLWDDNITGTFNIQAIATDKNSGKTGTSNKLTVTVIPFVGGD